MMSCKKEKEKKEKEKEIALLYYTFVMRKMKLPFFSQKFSY